MSGAVERQRGSGPLLMVLLMLLMGSLLLNATRRQLSDSLSLVANEGAYLQQFSQARSALAWGLRQSWSGDEGWQCRQLAAYHWRACLQRPALLLRADSGPGTLALYHWVSGRGAAVNARPHGWLDHCPLADKEQCNVEPSIAPAGL